MPALSGLDTLAIFLGGLCAGILNAVAGGGTLISYPILLWVGRDPIIANATNALAPRAKNKLPQHDGSSATQVWQACRGDKHQHGESSTNHGGRAAQLAGWVESRRQDSPPIIAGVSPEAMRGGPVARRRGLTGRP
jgi:hypothetical protein